jgi:hypothetical protein
MVFRTGDLMLSVQSAYGLGFCAIGALMLAVAHYQAKHYQVGKVPLISLRAKHAIAILSIIVGALILVSKLILRV